MYELTYRRPASLDEALALLGEVDQLRGHRQTRT